MNHVLITGADGHLGRWIVSWLLENTSLHLLLWVRATNAESLQKKTCSLQSYLNTGRCTLHSGDLRQDDPFASIDTSIVEFVVHSAAETAFNISKDKARQINVDGTHKLLGWASRVNNLKKIILLSTIYACGLRSGVLEEEPLDEAEEFANHYEWSKWAAERLLIEQYPDLPWQILRIGTLLADDNSGRVTQFNAVHNTLRLVFYGLLSIVPGDASTRLYMTTTEFAAVVCGRLLLSDERETIYHVSDDGKNGMRLGPLLDTVYGCFLKDTRFRQMGILKPLLCDWESFSTLVEGTSQFSGVLGQSINSVAPFAPQLYVDKEINIERLRTALPDLTPPSIKKILPQMCDQLISTRWGLKNPGTGTA